MPTDEHAAGWSACGSHAERALVLGYQSQSFEVLHFICEACPTGFTLFLALLALAAWLVSDLGLGSCALVQGGVVFCASALGQNLLLFQVQRMCTRLPRMQSSRSASPLAC